MSRSPADRFHVYEYDSYSGWDTAWCDPERDYEPRLATRREAWTYVQDRPGAVLRVYRVDGDGTTGTLVWRSRKTPLDADHSAWLGRCPR